MMNSSSKKLYCPIEQTWTITEEKLKEMKNKDAYCEISSVPKEAIVFPHVKHNFILSNQIDGLGNAAFFLFLELKRPQITTRIRAKFSFFIESENYSSSFDFIFDHHKRNSWGDEICVIEEFFDSSRNFIVDGKCTIEMKGLLIFNDEPMPKMIPAETGPLVQQLWESDDKDFKIVVGDEGNVLIHKMVLSVRSNSFQAMFRSNREEAKTNTLKIIDFQLKTVQLAVEFFYDRHIFDTLDLDDAFELVRFADKYIINDLHEKLQLHVIYQLSPSTVCQLANRSIAANSIKLRQICMDFIITCSKHSIAVKDFDMLDKELAAELIQKTFSLTSD